MKLTIELDREVDGRWIADIPELNVLLYGESKEDAVERAERAAREIIADRIAHGELPPQAANPVFAVAREQMACGESQTRPRCPAS